jgi:hypothetical protein
VFNIPLSASHLLTSKVSDYIQNISPSKSLLV